MPRMSAILRAEGLYHDRGRKNRRHCDPAWIWGWNWRSLNKKKITLANVRSSGRICHPRVELSAGKPLTQATLPDSLCVGDGTTKRPAQYIGPLHLTYHSPTLGKGIAMGWC